MKRCIDAPLKKCEILVIASKVRGRHRSKKVLGRGSKTGYDASSDYRRHDRR